MDEATTSACSARHSPHRTQNLPVLAAQEYSGGSAGAQDINTAFFLSNGPIPFDPASGSQQAIATKLRPYTYEDAMPWSNGRPMIPDGVSRDIRNFNNTIPSVDAWNISVQRQVTPTISVTASYVGNKGTHTHGDGQTTTRMADEQEYVKGCNDTTLPSGLLVPNATCTTFNGATPGNRVTPYTGRHTGKIPETSRYGVLCCPGDRTIERCASRIGTSNPLGKVVSLQPLDVTLVRQPIRVVVCPITVGVVPLFPHRTRLR